MMTQHANRALTRGSMHNRIDLRPARTIMKTDKWSAVAPHLSCEGLSMPNPIMQRLYGRLATVGLTRKYLRDNILPVWWDDEAADNPTAFAQGLMHISRYVGIAYSALADEDSPLEVEPVDSCKFKKTTKTRDDELLIARSITTQAARIALTGLDEKLEFVPQSADLIRDQILSCGEPWVGLSQLLDYCWSSGIPVLHIPEFPRGCKKMDGMAAMVDGHPAIVICKNGTAATLLFILAHELGHICLSHITRNGVIIDEQINDLFVEGSDVEEDAANRFAIHLLTGSPCLQVFNRGRWPNASQLAKNAIALGREKQIDPGHLVLNYGHSMGDNFWPVAFAALAKIESKRSGAEAIKRKFASNYDWSNLPTGQCEFLTRVTKFSD